MIRAAVWLIAGLGLSSCAYYYPVPVAAPQGTPAPAAANCRQFTRTVTIDGKDIQAVGYACEQPDGSWRLM